MTLTRAHVSVACHLLCCSRTNVMDQLKTSCKCSTLHSAPLSHIPTQIGRAMFTEKQRSRISRILWEEGDHERRRIRCQIDSSTPVKQSTKSTRSLIPWNIARSPTQKQINKSFSDSVIYKCEGVGTEWNGFRCAAPVTQCYVTCDS